MYKIDEIDINFKLETNIDKEDIVFYNALNSPFKIFGVFYENDKFRRMPESVAKTVSDGVFSLHTKTAGGRVRFKTNSPYVAILAKMGQIGKMSHFTIAGSAGFDLYIRNDGIEEYYKTFIPFFDIKDGYESVQDFETAEEREITINFPLYSEVYELYIGVSKDSYIDAPQDYKIKKPVVYYGSSITQGACASRPGNAYQSMISRRFDCDYINLGFAGNAKAENEIIEYVKDIDMSLFVYDYDHNAPTLEHLMNTHNKMFKAVRGKNPDLPIIIMSRPKFRLTKDEMERLAVIRATYDNAIASGDKNVYFISGEELMKKAKNDGTVDDCHPNDLGFASMAQALGDVMEQII